MFFLKLVGAENFFPIPQFICGHNYGNYSNSFLNNRNILMKN